MRQIKTAKSIWILGIILLSTILLAQPRSEYVGDWKGKLNAGGTILTIVFHIEEIDGKLISTMDSPDQGAFGFKVSETNVDMDNITLTVPSIGGEYIGQLDESWIMLNGTWNQGGQSFNLILTKQSKKILPPDEIKFDQIYEGQLKVGAVELRIVLKTYKDDSGNLAAYMDSPDQGAKNIAVSSISKNAKELLFEVKSAKGTYKGKFTDNQSVEGIWKQAGQTMELNFKIVDEVKKTFRPQTPQKPYPYKEEEVKIENEKDNVELAGTLTIPKGDGPFPAVVMVSGSGAQDRDETIFEHRPFLVIADYLTRNGIAVLRYDDRGTAESTGDFTSATTEDFTHDAVCAVEYLAGRDEIDNNIGIIGHSEGGLVAPLAALTCDELDFIVLMAGPGLPGKEILLMQTALISRVAGESEENIARAIGLNTKVFEVVETVSDNEAALAQINILVEDFYKHLPDSVKSRPEYSRDTFEANLKQVTTNWARFFISYDPRPTLEKITIPVLAINGEKDLQVPPKENLAEIEKALNAAGNTNFKTLELPGLNHLFQTSETGAISEYGKIEESFSVDAMEIMKEWILEVTRR